MDMDSKLLVDSTESEEEEIVHKAFDRTFQDPSDLSKRFMNFIENCLCEYEMSKEYYPPYTTLVQSQWHRKIKIIEEFCRKPNDITYLAYICACFQKLKEFKGSCKEWIDEHTGKNSQVNFWKDIECRMTDITCEPMKSTTDGKMTEGINKYLDEERMITQENTHSNISNFSPVSYLDLSKRVAERGSQLFEPFYLLDTVDYGRPLWDALLTPSSTEGFKPECIIELAMDKLIGGKSFILWKKEAQNRITIMETLAIFGPHLCIDIVPQSRYASHLIASYMHLCLDISEDRECIITSMPTEPVLAEAASQIMNDSNVNLTKLINQLSSALKKGVIEAGYHGELAARLLLLKAWDDYDVYRRIENHLEEQVKFTGTKFGEAYIKFTHFINITYTPDRKSLSALHEKLSKDHISYVLIQVKNWSTDNNKGDDYPLSATASPPPAYIGIEELPHMPFLSLYLQLGATKEFIDVPTEFFKSPQTCQIALCKHKIEEVLKDYQTDDDKTSEILLRTFHEHFQKPLALFGLSSNIYSCLKQFTSNPTTSSLDLTNSFKQLLTAWVDPTLGECPEKMKIVKHMEPWVYKMEQ
ncbi:8084_t:CDS:2 [Entrophospora sp. SA101]|nr:12072_t:CDS:2 [Entrophospora sp. SA101]CAJ0922936.1 8084_t:CDS:2 [Entrophospora sp. SA101]